MLSTDTAPRQEAALNGLTVKGLRREHVNDIQRARLLAAMAEIVAERGLADATVARIVAGAGVSRRTFYELFEDRERCFLATLDDAFARAAACVVPAYESGQSWAERLRLALAALLSFLDYERGAGRLLVVGSLGAGAEALERRGRVLAQIVTIVEQGRSQSKTAHQLPPLTAEGLVGGVVSIVHARVVAGAYPLTELQAPLMSMIVTPYLGQAAARRELRRPSSQLPVVAPRSAGDPLRDLGMRLTYRTVRVLLFLAEHPGCSNREVGAAAGIHDQGQISRLLSRLQRIGLAGNDGGPPAKGAPNAWRLTEKGCEVERTLKLDGARAGVAS